MRRLITIPISHYCEKARWALDRAGLDYEEHRHIQVVHIAACRLAGGGATSPVLVCEEGVFSESGSIVGYAARHAPPDRALEPDDPVERAEAMAVERWLDVDFGADARRWTYFHIEKQPELIRKYNPTGVPAWERVLFPLAMPVVAAAIRKVLDITPETAARSKRRVWETFDAIGERLSDGRPFLVGDRFSRADLTWAALAGAVLAPPQYGVPLPQPDEMEASVADQVRAFREHPAGAFAMRIWATERR